MPRHLLLLVVALAGCGREPEDGAATSIPEQAAVPVSGPVSRPAPLVPRPKDQAELDRLILAGYTPHADHLHAPGVDECPLTKGTEAVM